MMSLEYMLQMGDWAIRFAEDTQIPEADLVELGQWLGALPEESREKGMEQAFLLLLSASMEQQLREDDMEKRGITRELFAHRMHLMGLDALLSPRAAAAVMDFIAAARYAVPMKEFAPYIVSVLGCEEEVASPRLRAQLLYTVVERLLVMSAYKSHTDLLRHAMERFRALGDVQELLSGETGLASVMR